MRKLILITGGTSGLGLAIAQSIADRYDLALGYKSHTERALENATRLTKLFPEATIKTYKVPLHSHESSHQLLSSVEKDFPAHSLYGFIHCAGSTATSLYTNTTFEEQLSLIQEHLIAGMALAHLCLPAMYKNKSGRILFMSSVSANFAYRGHTGYAAAKSGLEAFARTLALEVAHRGVTVNCIAPGLISTPLTQDKIKKMDPASLKNINPMGELPKSSDVASLAKYLLLNKARFITGATIPVDGGQSLGDLKS